MLIFGGQAERLGLLDDRKRHPAPQFTLMMNSAPELAMSGEVTD